MQWPVIFSISNRMRLSGRGRRRTSNQRSSARGGRFPLADALRDSAIEGRPISGSGARDDEGMIVQVSVVFRSRIIRKQEKPSKVSRRANVFVFHLGLHARAKKRPWRRGKRGKRQGRFDAFEERALSNARSRFLPTAASALRQAGAKAHRYRHPSIYGSASHQDSNCPGKLYTSSHT